MSPIRLGPSPEDFIWASGVEDTFVPQIRPGARALDEYELMGHYEHWREDLALARELGAQALRWGVPWYRVEPLPGQFDWRWTDQVIPYLVEDLGITPILDLMHYGTPFWLEREFANPGYPQAVAAYAAAFARRYGNLVRWYTPLNEPFINAVMCGRIGVWPPYLRGQAGQFRVMLHLVKGILATVRALKEIVPDAVMVHVDATGLTRAARPDLQALADEDQIRRYLSYDLLTGRITPDHPLFPTLVRNGVNPDELAAIAAGAISLDTLGINFYPQWSTKSLGIDRRGRLAYRNVEKEGPGFAQLIIDYYERFKVPVLITETSALPPATARTRWLAESVAAVKYLRSRGVPVLGYTWFPMFTMIDWRYRHGRGPVEQYRIELGLYKLGARDGDPRWIATPLVEQYQSYIRHPAEAIGPLGAAPVETPVGAARERE